MKKYILKTFCLLIVLALTIPMANAEVAGMDRFELKYDYDFKNAVEDVTEDVVEDAIGDMSSYDFKSSYGFKQAVKDIIQNECNIKVDYNNRLKLECY